MKKFVVFGLGNFGFNIARTLIENGCEVLGVDINMDTVKKYKDTLTHAITADASKKEVIEALQIKDYDGAIISIGQHMSAGILTSLYLKEIGFENIIARAISEDHGKILEKLGVSEVIFPEMDIAQKIANKLSLKNAIDYLPISDEYGIVEVVTPKNYFGKTLFELKIPTKFSCQVIGIKYLKAGTSSMIKEELLETKIAPGGNDILKESSIMILLGKLEDIEKLQSSFK